MKYQYLPKSILDCVGYLFEHTAQGEVGVLKVDVVRSAHVSRPGV